MIWYRALFIVALGFVFSLIGPSGLVDAESGGWTSIPPLSTARSELAAVTGADGRIYAIGGSSAGGVSLAIVESFDVTANSWARVAPLPQPRQDMAAVRGPDGRIYVIGGRSCTSEQCSFPARVDVYNPKTNTWSTSAPLPTPRAGLGAALGPDGRIYAVGGWSNSLAGAAPNGQFATVEVYDPASDTWHTVAPLPTARSALAVVTGPDGRIYAIGGGYPEALGSVSLLDAYDPSTNTWNAVTNMPTDRANLAAVMGPDGRIYAIGGSFWHEGPQGLSAVEAYTASANRWEKVASLPTPLAVVAGTVGLDGRIYVLGAQTSMVSLTFANEVFTPPCRFVLGFGLLRARIPNTVGFCLADEQYNAVMGDALQRTTGGLLVWRKADNLTAFTDGYHTWVDGPHGVQERLNTERFSWEPNPDGLPTVR